MPRQVQWSKGALARGFSYPVSGTRWRRTMRPALTTAGIKSAWIECDRGSSDPHGEAFRAYLTDPNYIKTVALESAERIRNAWNSGPYSNSRALAW
jgi:hypothetical protein